ncbi:MAG TPA: hypothetical protein V6C78_08025 [Crinalium sp.]
MVSCIPLRKPYPCIFAVSDYPSPLRADSAAPPSSSSSESESIFRLSPLIRLTLLLLYVALTLPLPFLAIATSASIPPSWLAVGLVLGGMALFAALTERVILTEQGIQVAYPGWVPRVFRKGWFLKWQDITALKPRSTGQGGLVYYFLSTSGEAFLLPMRVAGFARLVRHVQKKTGIDTTDVRPLSQPWMYFILLVFTLLLLLIDGWTIWTALGQLG